MTTLHEEFAEAKYGWRPPKRQYTGEVHEVLVGRLRSGEQRVSEYGPYPSIVFELLEDQGLTVFEYGEDEPARERTLRAGDTVRLNVLGDVLKREFRDAGAKPGAELKVAYLGKTGDKYTDPVIWRVRRVGGSFDSSLFGDAGPGDAEVAQPEEDTVPF